MRALWVAALVIACHAPVSPVAAPTSISRAPPVEDDNVRTIRPEVVHDNVLAPLAVDPASRALVAPQTLARDQRNVRHIVVDEGGVYWTASDGIWHSSLAGGDRVKVVGDLAGEVTAMAGDPTDLYLVLAGTPRSERAAERSKLLRIAKVGGAPVQLATVTRSRGIAVDEAEVFVTNDVDDGIGQVLAIPKVGGPARVLADHQGRPTSIAIDRDTVYWIEHDHNATMRVDKHGGLPELLFEGGDPPVDLVVTDAAVLVTLSGAGIVRVAKTGGPVTVLSEISGGPLATDGKHVYCLTGWLVLAVPLDGGPTRVLALAPTDVGTIAVLGDAVYWTDAFLDAVQRTSRIGGAVFIASLPARPGELAVDGADVFFLDRRPNDDSDYIVPAEPDRLFTASARGTSARDLLHESTRPTDRIESSVLAVDRSTTYLSDATARTILAIPRAGGSAKVVARGFGCVTSLAVDSQAIYVADCERGVRRIAKRGHAERVLAAPSLGVRTIALAGATVFVATKTGDLLGIPVAGGATIRIAGHQGSIGALAVADTTLYWAIGRSVFRAARSGGGNVQLVVALSRPSPYRFYDFDLNVTRRTSFPGLRHSVPAEASGDVPIRSLALARDAIYVTTYLRPDIGRAAWGEVLRIDPGVEVPITVLSQADETSNLVVVDDDLYVGSSAIGAVLAIGRSPGP